MTEPVTKTSRIEARVSPATKDRLVRAAAIQGRSLSEFVLSAVMEKADHVIQSHEVMVLSAEDRDAFFAALRTPPKPNAALKRAVAAMRRNRRS